MESSSRLLILLNHELGMNGEPNLLAFIWAMALSNLVSLLSNNCASSASQSSRAQVLSSLAYEDSIFFRSTSTSMRNR